MTSLRFLMIAALLLSACRASISPTPAATRTPGVAQVPASLQVCWVESARFGPATASSLLVRHPQGDVLIDAGNSTRLREEIRVYDRRTQRWLRTLPGSLRPRTPLAALLRAVGADPSALRWVLPTHAHLDHVGGVLDLPPTPVLLSEPEIALVAASLSQPGAVIPAHARALQGHETPLAFVNAPYETFERHADLFGDGSVVVVPLAGHTPGSVAVFVTRPDGTRILHVGDAVNERSQVEHLRGRAPIMRRTDEDEAQANANVARLHELVRQVPALRLLPAHDRRAWSDLLGQPGQPCPAPTRQSPRHSPS